MENLQSTIDGIKNRNCVSGKLDARQKYSCSRLTSDIQLLVIFIPYLISHPSRTTILYEQLQSLISLLLSEVVHGQGTEMSLFESVLDAVTWIMDDMPRDISKGIFVWLGVCS